VQLSCLGIAEAEPFTRRSLLRRGAGAGLTAAAFEALAYVGIDAVSAALDEYES